MARAEAHGQNREAPVTADPGETEAGTAGAGTADLTLDAKVAAADVPPAILAQSLGQYLRAWWLRVRSGNSGVLPVVMAMVLVAVVFEIITPEHAFLRPSNLVYIFGLSTVYMVLAMAETLVLLLAEVDLSVGAVALIGGVIAFKLVQQPGPNWPWWLAVLASLAICGAIGALQGSLTALLRVPSFVATLAGFLLFSGVLVIVLGGADTDREPQHLGRQPEHHLRNGPGADPPRRRLDNPGGCGRGRRRIPGASTGLEAAQGPVGPAAEPDRDQDRADGDPRGGSGDRLLGQPRQLAAVGHRDSLGYPDRPRAVRRLDAGAPADEASAGTCTPPAATRRLPAGPASTLSAIRIWAFALCSATAALGGILLGSFFYGEYSSNTADPGQLVLYTVAAAVIGGVSLFGGRGKAIHGVLGGLLIGGIAYGVSLLNLGSLSTPLTYILPGGVLLVAVLIDVSSRRGAGA